MISIRPLRGAKEARACATVMARSEPWITLRYKRAQSLRCLEDGVREVHVAMLRQAVVGCAVLNLRGPLNGYLQTMCVAP
jgi:hypothetical protein